MENTSSKPKKQGGLFSKFAFAMGNMGHAAFYAALSNYFIIFVTSGLFVGLPKNIANKLIVLITTLIVVIRVVEIMIDPVLGNIVDNTRTKWGKFKPWILSGTIVSSVTGREKLDLVCRFIRYFVRDSGRVLLIF